MYMTQPKGFIFPSHPHHVCKLQRSLYGLKQAPRAWFTRLKTTLNTFGFNNTIFDNLGKMNYFLGIEAIKRTDNEILLYQAKYIKELLAKASMHDAMPMPTPMASSLKLSVHDGEDLQYAIITRPDIIFAVNKVSQFMHHPLDSHWKAVKRILRYLAGTYQHGLRFQRSSECKIYRFSDSDWGSDVDDMKSTSGFCVYLGPNLVSWSSRK
ncbi:hypothetical protein AAHE18_04G088000 [Arachis hypogaea]